MEKSGAGTLYGVNFMTALFTAENFHGWRTSMRNFFDHRRRVRRWWRNTSLDLWLQADGTVRGILNLGDSTTDEVQSAFDRRWAVTLKPIEVEDLRRDIYFALHPTRVARFDGRGRRYQGVRLTIGPRRAVPPPRVDVMLGSPLFGQPGEIAPMPILL